ncbi:MAG: CBS domain-containing protein [Geobacteraceae bacterium]|nr:CBS domain-containing protein [Geobacteraceae bacterium]NTW79536.1 CBS domain-containing protein [Geobacteraceae bacterium]
MNRWKDVLISPTTSIIDTIKIIDATALQIALVVDDNNRLLGTLTDGDVRRAILNETSLTDQVQTVMNREFTSVSITETRDNILALMKGKQFHQIPVLDENRCIVGLELLDEILSIKKRDNLVVLMAGGLGTRLGHLTKECPKPLLKVGNKVVLETIINNCKEYGLYRFALSINYKAEMIQDYCGDGKRWGVEISYVHENKRLGTAGALGLLQTTTDLPVLVMNADVLTKVNFQHLLDFHEDHQSVATMCVREYDFQVPYGVVKIDKQRLLGIEEKPVHRFFVSAGIYLLNPEILSIVPKDEYFDMPSLFEKVLEQNMATTVFPIREYWLDIGKIDDFERANGEYDEVFS